MSPGVAPPSLLSPPVRVLLAEDETSLREVIAAHLSVAGFEVTAVPDGRGALRRLLTEAFDVVVTDLCMPDRDGMELLVELARRQAGVPVIVISGGIGGEPAGMLRAAALLGARRVLAKPFPLDDLAAAITEVSGAGATLRAGAPGPMAAGAPERR